MKKRSLSSIYGEKNVSEGCFYIEDMETVSLQKIALKGCLIDFSKITNSYFVDTLHLFSSSGQFSQDGMPQLCNWGLILVPIGTN